MAKNPAADKLKHWIRNLVYFSILAFIIVMGVIGLGKSNLPNCIGPTQLGSVKNTTISVHADGYYASDSTYRSGSDNIYYGRWKDTGVSVHPSDSFQVITSGSIYTYNRKGCINVTSWGTSGSYGGSVTGDCYLSKNESWSMYQDTDITINHGDYFNLYIGDINNFTSLNNRVYSGNRVAWDPQSITANKSCTYTEFMTQRDCYAYNGMGISIYIGSTPINDRNKGFEAQTSVNGVNYYSNNNEKGFVINSASITGKIQFKSSDYGTQKSDFVDNAGGYTFNYHYLPVSSKADKGLPVGSNAANPAIGQLQVMIASSDPNLGDLSNSSIINLTSTPQMIKATVAGTIYMRVYDTFYSDNYGQYIASINKFEVATNADSMSGPIISGLVNYVIMPIKKQLFIARSVIYHNFASDSKFHKIGIAAINLYIIFYAVFFTLGLVQISQADLVVRIVKIGVILNLINTDYSWKFFNFYIFQLFEGGASYILSVVTKQTLGATNIEANLFGFIDETLGFLFSKFVIHKISSLLLHPYGVIYAYFIIITIMVFTFVLLETVIAYIFALIATALMIGVAPIFIMCLLFDRTREYFENWYKQLFNFTIQPIILIICVLFVYRICLAAFFESISFTACWGCILEMPFIGWWVFPSTLCLFSWYIPVGINTSTFILQVIPSIFIFYVFTQLLKSITDFAPKIAATLTGTVGGNVPLSGEGSISNKVAEAVKDNSLGVVGMDKASKGRRR
jgi:type IV secretion system protein VirB6